MKFFKDVEEAPIDPIFGVRLSFEKDTRPGKVDLGVGVYRTADLKPYILTSVKKAEEFLLKNEINKEYLPIGGEPAFLEQALKLTYGNDVVRERFACIQCVGGTGGLRLAGEFLIRYVGKSFYLPDPTWDNHRRLFSCLGFSLESLPYYDYKKHCYNHAEMVKKVRSMPEKGILFMQACCHNPTGFDPSFAEWQEIAEIVKEKKLLPFFDFAYQGLGEGIEEDAAALRLFSRLNIEHVVVTSFSKNFGLYAERTGALFIYSENKNKIESQLKVLIRTLYSNPPCHGGRIVSHILQDKDLRELWEKELMAMRTRICEMRKSLLSVLVSLNEANALRFAFLQNQKGMFSYTGLDIGAVERLVSEYGIYMLKEGRINVSGLNSENLYYVAEAISHVA